VIIDCDPGIDDALALLYSFASPNLDIRGITSVAGNVNSRAAYKNILKIAELASVRRLFHIGRGKDSYNLSGGHVPDRKAHGADGLGDTGIEEADDRGPGGDSPRIISDLLKRGEADHIVALGPLSNIAWALTKSPSSRTRAKRIYAMGGRFKGADEEPAEFNFRSDPKAADIILGLGLPVTLVGLDVSGKIFLRPDDLKRFKASERPVCRFIAAVSDYAFRRNREIFGRPLMYVHDAIVTYLAEDEGRGKYKKVSLGVRTKSRSGTVYLKGQKADVKLCVSVDGKKFLKYFLSRLEEAYAA
jgi:inosine-uridine nucleoside N-ribohydrolase